MLPGEGLLLPETLSAQKGVTVNNIFELTGELSDNYHRKLFQSCLKLYQEKELERLLGPRWHSRDQGGITCPSCGGKSHKRKGFRARIVKTSKGKFYFQLAQVQCNICGRSHRPFAAVLGIAMRRVLPELEEKAICLAVKLPFKASSDVLKELGLFKLSAEGIRKLLNRKATELKIEPPGDVIHCMVDSTKVKAGAKRRGENVQFAIAVEKGPKIHGRPVLLKNLLHLSVGDAAPLKATLKKVRFKYLVHDGELDLKGFAGKTQRCLWHMGHQLKHYLWQDGLPHQKRGAFRAKLCGILYGSSYSARGAAIAYGKLISKFRRLGLNTSAGHLALAKEEIFNYRKDPMLCFATTSPVEREMRELNRRADVGARWSPQGIENLLKILFLKRFNQY